MTHNRKTYSFKNTQCSCSFNTLNFILVMEHGFKMELFDVINELDFGQVYYACTVLMVK